MSIQDSQEVESAADSLLETKLQTDSTQQVKIKSGRLVYMPVLKKYYENERSTIIPSLNGLLQSVVKTNENTEIVNSEEHDIEEDENELSINEIRDILLSYFQSDEYHEKIMSETNVQNISRTFEPMVVILAEQENGNLIQLLVKKPFSQSYADKLFETIEVNDTVALDYNSRDELIMNLDDNINVKTSMNNYIESMSLEYEFITQDEFNETYCWKYLDNSEYHNWLDMPVESFEKIDSNTYELTLEDNQTWTLDKPEFWNSSHDTVKLIEEFADGHPELLETVLIRPENPSTNNKIKTITNNNGWELAIEKPSVKSEPKGNKQVIKEEIIIPLLLALTTFASIFGIFFMISVI